MACVYTFSDLKENFVRKNEKDRGIYLFKEVKELFSEGDIILGWRAPERGDTFIFNYKGVLVKNNGVVYPLMGTEDIGIHTGHSPTLNVTYEKKGSTEWERKYGGTYGLPSIYTKDDVEKAWVKLKELGWLGTWRVVESNGYFNYECKVFRDRPTTKVKKVLLSPDQLKRRHDLPYAYYKWW